MSAATQPLSEAVEWKLTEMLFSQRVILFAGGLMPMTVSALGFARTGREWFVWWGVAAALILAARLAVNEAFPRRRVRSGGPALWRRCFLAGTWANGAICGLGGAGAVLGSDPFMQMLVITMLIAFVMGSAARNGVYPCAAVGSILLAAVPLFVACLATRDVYYTLYTFFIVAFGLASISVVRHQYSQTVRFLVTDEERAVLVSEVSAANEQLAAANEKLASIAETDGLTGVPNRRSFDCSFEREVRAARRYASDLSLLMLDIDAFKAYNDRYGHQAGDACLLAVARTLANVVRRPRDVVARYGGEEFVFILPQTNFAGAIALAEALRESVEALAIEHAACEFGVVTVSIGAATSSAGGETASADLLRRADEALYVAKQSGRNRVHGDPNENAPGSLGFSAAHVGLEVPGPDCDFSELPSVI